MRLDFGLGLRAPPRPALPRLAPPPHWSAASFAAGEEGFAYDPATPEGLWQDAAGTVPVTADGDPVGRMDDRSGRGHHAVQPLAARRPLWRTDGARGWLAFDGTDDELEVPAAALRQAATTLVAVAALAGDGFYPMILGDASTSDGLTAGFGDGGARVPRFGVAGHAPVVLRAGAAQPVGSPAAMHYGFDGAARVLARDGAELARDAQAAPWTPGTQPLLCYSGSNVLKSPVRLHGAVCVDRGVGGAEAARLAAAMGRPLGAAGAATVLGDSTVAAYAGQGAVLAHLGTARTARDLSAPGHTITQQKAAWQAAGVVPTVEGYALVQVGLNDLDPAEPAAAAVARLQDLVDTVRADAGGMALLVAGMIPARQRLLNVYGAAGEAAHAKWAAINAAIAGEGAQAIAGVDGRVTAHVAALDDGTGRLAAAYDTGDGIHPNAAGRAAIADAWRTALAAMALAA